MLPFFPLIPSLFTGEANFWTGDQFLYDINSLEMHAMSLIWLASCIGVIFGLWAQKISVLDSATLLKPKRLLQVSFVFKKLKRLWAIFFATVVFITWRLVVGGDAGGEVIFGGEMIICILILFLVLIVKFIRNVWLFAAVLILGVCYIFSQILYGDRDFFIIFIGFMLLIAASNASGYKGVLKLSGIGLVIVFFGALISMIRLDVNLTVSELFSYFFFNSWTATIQPVLLMLSAEYDVGPSLFGKSYLDLILSIVPSFIYAFFEAQKPIVTDNPAMWFYVEGMGGMHAAGVAWRNFGIFGVFFQCFMATFLFSKIEKLVIRTSFFWAQFFYLVVASQVMHTVWYSLVSMVNALVLYVFIFIFFNAEFVFGLSKHSATER